MQKISKSSRDLVLSRQKFRTRPFAISIIFLSSAYMFWFGVSVVVFVIDPTRDLILFYSPNVKLHEQWVNAFSRVLDEQTGFKDNTKRGYLSALRRAFKDGTAHEIGLLGFSKRYNTPDRKLKAIIAPINSFAKWFPKICTALGAASASASAPTPKLKKSSKKDDDEMEIDEDEDEDAVCTVVCACVSLDECAFTVEQEPDDDNDEEDGEHDGDGDE